MQQIKATGPESQWRELVAEMRASGKTQVAWCKEHDINPKTLGNWIREFKQRDDATTANFVTAGVARLATAVPESTGISIQIGDYTISLDRTLDTVTIKSLAQKL